MKLKKLKQILELYLLDSRAREEIIKNTTSGFLTDFNLIQIISSFKKALYVIFKYHQAHKKILFVGLPKKLELKINRLTPHVAVDHNVELRGFISNNFKLANSTKVENRLISKLLKKPDLIVLLLHEKNQNIIIESNLAKIPIISFASTRCSKINMNKNFFNVGNFSQQLVLTSAKSLFFLGLNFVFKRIKKS